MFLDRFITERLTVRNWRPFIEDTAARHELEAALSAVLTNPVLEQLPTSLQLDHQGDSIALWIDARAAESEVLLVEQTDDEELIGLMILALDPDSEKPTFHIGYLLATSAWGQGFASELVNGLIFALARDGPMRLVGGVSDGNPASARVLQKTGFVLDPDLSTPSTSKYFRDID